MSHSATRMLSLGVFAVLALGSFAVLAMFGREFHSPRSAYAVQPAVDEVYVEIGDNFFDPQVFTVTTGTTVVWTNSGELSHTVSITGGQSSGNIAPADTYNYTFDSVGTFYYRCAYHPASMQGTVHVLDPSQQPVDLSVDIDYEGVFVSGALIRYNVYVYVNDLFSAQNTVLTVTMPSGSSLVESNSNGNPFPPAQQSGATLVYNLGSIPAWDSVGVNLDVRLPDVIAPGTIVALTAEVTAANSDPFTADNYSRLAESIDAANVTLSIRPSEDSGAFIPESYVTYTLEYINYSSTVVASSVALTNLLPSGLTFVSAIKDTGWASAITPTISGRLLTFDLGTVEAGDGGQILVQAQLATGLPFGYVLRNTGGVATTSAESDYDDNFAEDVQTVVSNQPNLWVELTSIGDGEIDGYQYYYVSYGNGGPQPASNGQLTVVLPSSLTDLDFGDFPPASRIGDVATWNIGTLQALTFASEGIFVQGKLSASGRITATATITSTSLEASPLDNVMSIGNDIAQINMPVIGGPSEAMVAQTPAFFGLGSPDATVSLYLSGTESLPGYLVGTDTVTPYGTWVITTAVPITPTGWYWFTATQELNGRVSPATGVGNYVTTTLGIDPNSITRDGERVGGINQPLFWRGVTTYTLGMRIIGCSNPLTPTLQALFYGEDGLMIGYQDFLGKPAAPGGYFEFEFLTPENGIEFELYVDYYCSGLGGGSPSINAKVSPRTTPAGWWGDAKKKRDCFTSLGMGCDPPPPPPPPKPCFGCSPVPRPGKNPKPVDPDGFVYDEEMAEAKIRAGASITQSIKQSIITQATVTATQQTAPGQFAPWNALEYFQANPQKTDGTWPDKVLVPGYYSFLVPPGKYRIQARAPGFVPFESQVLEVITTPVTLNVPMKRVGRTQQAAGPRYSIYLPAVMRSYSAGW